MKYRVTYRHALGHIKTRDFENLDEAKLAARMAMHGGATGAKVDTAACYYLTLGDYVAEEDAYLDRIAEEAAKEERKVSAQLPVDPDAHPMSGRRGEY
jgi:hypothetical protein